MLSTELMNKLRDFLKTDLSLEDYRVAVMRVRLDELESLPSRDKNFLYEFETRYAQLKAGAITDYTFRQLLTYAAACESTGSHQQAKVWILPDNPQAAPTGTPVVTENAELVA